MGILLGSYLKPNVCPCPWVTGRLWGRKGLALPLPRSHIQIACMPPATQAWLLVANVPGASLGGSVLSTVSYNRLESQSAFYPVPLTA